MTIRVAHLAGIVGLVIGVAPAHNARPVVLWGCHGPLGQPLGASGLAATTSGDVSASPATACDTAGGALVAAFTRPDPAGGSGASWRADAPAWGTLTGARVVRSVSVAAPPYASGGALQRYVARSSTGVLEAITLIDVWAGMPPGTFATATSGDWVSAGIDCARPTGERCGAGSAGSAAISAIGLEVDDAGAPAGSVGGVASPVRGPLTLSVNASDAGVGLARAQVLVDGAIASEVVLDERCADLDGGRTATPDVPLGGCAKAVSGVPLTVDLSGRAVGDHQLEVRVVDGAGNAADVWDGVVAVAGPAPAMTSTVEVKVGNPGAPGGGGGAGVGGAGSGGAGTTAAVPACLKPRLSMMLDQKPLRMTKARPVRPVLRAGTRYRFRGSLTCVVAGQRRAAPRGVPVEILNKVGKRTSGVTGATTTTGGKLTVILSYKSSRTLIFRHRSANGTSTVRIAIAVVKKKTPKKASR